MTRKRGPACLDSWAVLHYLEHTDRAARRIDRLLATEKPIMSWINIGEVFYQTHRAAGPAVADETVRDLRRRVTLVNAAADRVMAAARIKAVHQMAYADAFAVATAIAYDAVLLTGDPELLDHDVGCRVEDLRA